MRKFAMLVGSMIWWGGWPLMRLLLHGSERTRVIIVNEKGEILAVRLWLSSSDRWSLPGGGLHRDEKPLQGALRETYEEVGLALEPESLRFMGTTDNTSKGLYTKLHVFTARVEGEPTLRLQKHEIAAARWVRQADLTPETAHSDAMRALQYVAPQV